MPTTTTPLGAAVEPATVEIRTLTVNGRQMTPGFFRQLPELPAINVAGSINGTPWGFVNHHPDKCEDAKDHLHILWQNGDALNRAYVPSPEVAHFCHPKASEYVMALIAEGASRYDQDSPLSAYRSRDAGGAAAQVNLWGMSFWAPIPVAFLRAWDLGRNDLDALQESAVASGTQLRPSLEVARELPVEPYKASYRELSQLPQLFIGR